MVDASEDMTTPVTRGEMKQELAELEKRMDQRFEKIDQRFEKIDQRFEKIDQRFEKIDQRFDALERRFDTFRIEFDRFRIEVEQSIARHVTAAFENVRTFFVALDDKYKDLPPRVARLEAAVFPPVPPARAVRAAPKKRRRKAS